MIKFWILYIPLFILLPCAIDVKCIESDARLNIWSFDLSEDDSVQLDKDFKYNGTDVSHHFKCNRSDFRLFLKEFVKEAEELKKKNDADIKKNVSIDERGRTFNKRVLVVNRDQIEIVLEELEDILGCQECPTILFRLGDEKGDITDYNSLLDFCSKFLLKNGKTKVGKEQINEKKLDFDKPRLSEIFDNDKKNFRIITEYYLNNNSGEIIKTLFDLKKGIINDIKTLFGLREEIINDIKTATENIISTNELGQGILNFAAICEKYQQAENAILSSKNIKELTSVLNSYIRWRKILLQAQIIRTFIYFPGKKDIVKEKEIEETIKSRIGQEKIPDGFKDKYPGYFFSDTFACANYSESIKKMENDKTVKKIISQYNFSLNSFLDLFCLYSKIDNNLLFSSFLPKDGIFGSLNNILNELKKGTIFTEKESVLFKIVKETASNGTNFNKNVFYELDKQTKVHFNSIIFDYLTDLLGRVKKFLEDAGGEKKLEDAVGKGTKYDFHNANRVFEIIRVISSYINPVLKKKEGRPELIYNAILSLIKEMKTLSVSPYINGILMECSLVLNTLMEYFIYLKDFNAYVSESNRKKQLALKKDTISNKLENLCIINEEEYKNLLSLNGHTPKIIEAVAQRLYEYSGDEQKNNPFFKIVVMGDMRAGKTLLIRNLFDEAERFKFKVGNGDTSTTRKVTSYIRKYSGKDKCIQITDTPGFEGIKEKDLGYEEIDPKFDALFNRDDTVVLDIVLFREGCIDWLAENHKKIITRVLNETENKIIFLIPFTSLQKNAKKIKEKFLASLFYNLYIRGKDFPVEEEELKRNYKKFVERVIAIPINQLYSEENNESRFGLCKMGEAVKQCLSEKRQDDIFYDLFIKSLPGDTLCEEEEKKEDKKEEKKEEKIGPLKHLLLESLIGFNNFKLEIKDKGLIHSEALLEIDKKYSWYHGDKESYELLNCVYLFYLGSSSLINQFCTKSYDPLLYEIYKTEIYRLAEFITSPYFFNYLCLDNEKLDYNIFFFKEEIDLLNSKEELEEILKKKKLLAQFCLVADDPFFIWEGDYETIKKACVEFNSNYNNFKPLSSAENAMGTNYNLIKNKLDNYFGGKEESIGEIYLNFVVCYDTTQRRYIIDRTNLCFLGINLERNENQYEIIPKSLEDHIKNLNQEIKGNTTYRSFQDYITYDNILSRRYHHSGRKQLIRKRELECIEVVFNAIQEEKKKEAKGNIEDKKEEPKIEEKKEEQKQEKEEEEPKENRTIDQIEEYEIEEKKKDACVIF